MKDINGNEYFVETIINIIKTNFDNVESFNQLKSTKRARVELCNNDQYIRTKSDDTEENNLENLPTF